MKINLSKMTHDVQKSWEAFVFACGRQQPEDPHVSLMADEAIT